MRNENLKLKLAMLAQCIRVTRQVQNDSETTCILPIKYSK